jgi:hypothetical protein
MTIVRPLPSGEICEFPDDMSETEIAAALRDYVRSLRRETARERPARAEASGATPLPATGMRPILRRPTGPDEAVSGDSSPAPAPVVSLRMCHIGPYVADENELTPEQRRERLQRAGRPARLDPPDPYGNDRFRDNTMTWSIYRPR